MSQETLQHPQCWAECPWGPRDERVSRESDVGGAAAAQVHTSAAGAPGRSASPPHAASPGSAILTARGLGGGGGATT